MTIETRDFDAFTRQIADLDIDLSVNADGVFTASTTSEPLFCYDADSKEELAHLVGATLSSYGRLFFGLEGLNINVEDRDDAAGSVPLERATPIGHFKPVLLAA